MTVTVDWYIVTASTELKGTACPL